MSLRFRSRPGKRSRQIAAKHKAGGKKRFPLLARFAKWVCFGGVYSVSTISQIKIPKVLKLSIQIAVSFSFRTPKSIGQVSFCFPFASKKVPILRNPLGGTQATLGELLGGWEVQLGFSRILGLDPG